jgi:hypothetical protein
MVKMSMKKRGLSLVLILIFVSVSLINFVSAGTAFYPDITCNDCHPDKEWNYWCSDMRDDYGPLNRFVYGIDTDHVNEGSFCGACRDTWGGQCCGRNWPHMSVIVCFCGEGYHREGELKGGACVPNVFDCYADVDKDRYPNKSQIYSRDLNSCGPDSGYIKTDTSNPEDCDDTDPNVWQIIPGHVDGDKDGYGAGSLGDVCSGDYLPEGYAHEDLDCNDTNNQVNPGMQEDCSTPYDDDCDDPEDINEGCTSISQVSWRNMNRHPIYNNEVDLNDWVMLFVRGEQMQNKEINYTIFKREELLGVDFFWPDKKVAKSSTIGFTTWQADEDGTYYFEAKIESFGMDKSNDLIVLESEDNFFPIADITGPEDRQMYFLGTELNFTQASYDEDDEFNYVWNLGDGTIKTGNSVNKTNWSFSYTYETPGQKNVLLTVDDGRGGFGRDYISILIINSSHVLSYIDSPRWGEETSGQNIQFDASGSYVVEYNGASVNCLAGNCPLTTGNCPPDPFVCTNNLSLQNVPSEDYTGMNFTWIFTNGLTGNTMTEKKLNNPRINRTFSLPSTPENPHKATLTINYE